MDAPHPLPDPRRRGLLALALAAGVPPGIVGCATARSWTTDPFALGVASGCPRPDSIVLWTRLAPEAAPGDGEPVLWEIAIDERFANVVRRGRETALAADAHSVHVVVDGLGPDRWYHYRFTAGDARSEAGRTRTAPAPGSTAAFAFAIASCQHWETGHYAAWRHLADEPLDAIVFLGDYIYEGAPSTRRVRTHVGSGPAITLEQYRARYAQYRSDADLRRAHAQFPWILTWDDHEVQNDYASDRGEDLSPTFMQRRAAAYRAWWEHMPVPPSMKPVGPDLRVYDRYDWGAVARLHMLDDRQYRDYHACPPPGRAGSTTVNLADCPELLVQSRTILGAAQERWLGEGLKRRDVRWNLVGQQTFVAPFTWTKEGRVWTDGWAGYPGARDRLFDAIAADRTPNVVFLGGDVHCHYVSDIKRRVDDPADRVIASEFCGTSISSLGLSQARIAEALAFNPHIKLGRADLRGYTSLRVSTARCEATLRVVEDATKVDAGVSTLARFVVESGRPGPQTA